MKAFNRQRLRTLYLLPLLLVTLMLSSCVDLSGSSYIEKKSRRSAHASNTEREPGKRVPPKHRGEVHTMRGGLGVFSLGMNQLKTNVAKKYHVPSSSTMWYNAGEVTHEIAAHYYKYKNHRPVILIGHSLGANEQIKVARDLERAGVPVALLVTIDSVSQTRVPGNVKEVLNLYKPGFVPMFSGLRLTADNPHATTIQNINVNKLAGVKTNHFIIDKDTVVQNMIMAKVEKVLRNANRKEASG